MGDHGTRTKRHILRSRCVHRDENLESSRGRRPTFHALFNICPLLIHTFEGTPRVFVQKKGRSRFSVCPVLRDTSPLPPHPHSNYDIFLSIRKCRRPVFAFFGNPGAGTCLLYGEGDEMHLYPAATYE